MDTLLVPTAAARAWLADMMRLRHEVDAGKLAGTIGAGVGAPDGVERSLWDLLAAVRALDGDQPEALIPLPPAADFRAFVQYHRAAMAWIDDLVASGTLPSARDPLAEQFNTTLYRAVGPPTPLAGRALESVLAQAPEAILAIDLAGVVRYANAVAAVLHGGAPVGRPLVDLLHPAEAFGVIAAFLGPPDEACSPRLLVYRVRAQDGWRQVETVGRNLLDDPDVRSVVLFSRDVTERNRTEHAMAHQAFHDPLTDLANRALFLDRLEHALARIGRDGQPVAILLLDLDGFKAVNDTLGHHAGDQLLVEVSRRLGPCIRPADTLARLGGDEFAVLLEDARDALAPERMAERMLGELSAPIQLGDARRTIGVSIGIATSGRDADADADADAVTLLRQADAAMYTAKRLSGSRFARYGEELGRVRA